MNANVVHVVGSVVFDVVRGAKADRGWDVGLGGVCLNAAAAAHQARKAYH